MKIGILTITDGANYGNRLQNYAMQIFLSSLGYEVETIRRSTPRDAIGIRRIIFLLKDLLKIVIGMQNTFFCKRRRIEIFNDFNKSYIFFSKYCLSNNKAPKELKNEYDYFICGSDQVWNANFEVIKCDIMNHLAAFANPKQRIAFAASFGTPSIANGYEDVFKNELSKFKAIAVREDAGKEIVDRLTNKQATVVLDPTLLIRRDDWEKIEKKPSYIEKERFIVTYFLGGRNPKMEKYIDELSREKNARVINLDIEFLSDDKIQNKDVFYTTPDEFVWLIHYAECVLTDSFHASAFSIIFEKPFVVFERIATEAGNNMESRIDTLLYKFNLLSCRDDICNPSLRPNKPDYSKIDELINFEREKGINFLKESLNK